MCVRPSVTGVNRKSFDLAQIAALFLQSATYMTLKVYCCVRLVSYYCHAWCYAWWLIIRHTPQFLSILYNSISMVYNLLQCHVDCFHGPYIHCTCTYRLLLDWSECWKSLRCCTSLLQEAWLFLSGLRSPAPLCLQAGVDWRHQQALHWARTWGKREGQVLDLVFDAWNLLCIHAPNEKYFSYFCSCTAQSC